MSHLLTLVYPAKVSCLIFGKAACTERMTDGALNFKGNTGQKCRKHLVPSHGFLSQGQSRTGITERAGGCRTVIRLSQPAYVSQDEQSLGSGEPTQHSSCWISGLQHAPVLLSTYTALLTSPLYHKLRGFTEKPRGCTSKYPCRDLHFDIGFWNHLTLPCGPRAAVRSPAQRLHL